MSKCEKCKHNHDEDFFICDTCIHNTSLKDKFEPLTNADRIRAMSDEELAKWMAECNAYGERAEASQWLPWLKQPAEGE